MCCVPLCVCTRRAQISNTTQTDLETDRTDNIPPEKLPTIWMRLPFIGKHGNILTKSSKEVHQENPTLTERPCIFMYVCM